MFDEKVEARLRGWARWVWDMNNGSMGYPKQSVIAVFQDGFSLRGEFTSIPLITDERAQQMDNWLKQMAVLYPDYREAIVFHYLSNKTPSEIAAALSISKRT